MSTQRNATQNTVFPTKFATVGDRIGMFILDGIVIGGLSFLIYLYLKQFSIYTSYHYLYNSDFYNNDASFILMSAIRYPYIYIAVGFAYHFVTEQSKLRGSFAKYLFGYRVFSTKGDSPNWKQSLMRNGTKVLILFGSDAFLHGIFDELSTVVNSIVIIACLVFLGNHPQKQAWSDLAAGTCVGK